MRPTVLKSDSRQLNRLKRADDVIRPFILKKAFVESRTKIPRISLIIFVPIKSPDAADDNQRTNAVVPKITQIMKTEVGPGCRTFEPYVIENDQLRHRGIVDSGFLSVLHCAGMITQRTQ